MKYFFLFVSIFIADTASAAGPGLGIVDNVVVIESGVDKKDTFSKYCKEFNLSALQAMSFINAATIVTQREVHDYYDILPCFVRGTAVIHGYPAEWEIRAGGTGFIILMSGERVTIVNETERNTAD